MSMSLDLSRMLDPVLLAIDTGITPDPWQSLLLRDMPRRALLLCSRQSGKTEAAVWMALHTALFSPGSLVVIVSPSQRQSAEMFRRVMSAYHKLTGVPSIAMESVLRAEFANGSRIIALPGTDRTVRGYARADLVII